MRLVARSETIHGIYQTLLHRHTLPGIPHLSSDLLSSFNDFGYEAAFELKKIWTDIDDLTR